jgi:hypothetical protein
MRRLLNIATTISLLMCLVTVVCWARSYSRSDYVAYARQFETELRTTPDRSMGRTDHFLGSERGAVHLERTTSPPPADFAWSPPEVPPGLRAGSEPLAVRDRLAEFHDLGHRCGKFGFIVHETPAPTWRAAFVPPHTRTALVVPHWFAAALFATAPVRWINRRRLKRGFARGLCPTCGYDLRATPERCPECGAVARAAA